MASHLTSFLPYHLSPLTGASTVTSGCKPSQSIIVSRRSSAMDGGNGGSSSLLDPMPAGSGLAVGIASNMKAKKAKRCSPSYLSAHDSPVSLRNIGYAPSARTRESVPLTKSRSSKSISSPSVIGSPSTPVTKVVPTSSSLPMTCK